MSGILHPLLSPFWNADNGSRPRNTGLLADSEDTLPGQKIIHFRGGKTVPLRTTSWFKPTMGQAVSNPNRDSGRVQQFTQ